MTDIRLLGPLSLTIAGKHCPIVSPKVRILVASLTLHVGQPVSTDSVAEAIWGDRQPGHPRRTVQMYVTRLRNLLGDSSALIVTCSEGYMLDAPPECVDVKRFDASCHRADRAEAAADHEGEMRALNDALAEWRAEPLADVPSPVLRTLVPGLRERLLAVKERYVAAQIRHGDHAHVVGELLVLTAQNPLREQLWMLLIRALHLNGRRGEALEAYNRYRTLLSERHGIDPSDALRSMYASLLNTAGRTAGDAYASLRRGHARPLQ